MDNIIDRIKDYLDKTKEGEKSFDDFIFKNKDVYLFNISNIDKINKDDLQLIYSLVLKDINSKLIIDYVKTKQIKIQKEQLLDSEIYNYIDLSEYNLYKLIIKYGTIEIYPKKIVFLWNNNKIKNIDVNTLYKTEKDTDGLVIKYVSYDELLKLYNKNKEYYKKSNILSNFNNLTRMIGVPISNKFLKIDYTLLIDISNMKLKININDHIKYNDFQITIDNKKISYNSININKIIEDFIYILIKKLKHSNLYIEYMKLFITNNKLSYYINYLLPECIISQKSKYNYNHFINIEEDVDIKENKKEIVCQHTQILKNLFKPSPDYFDKLNSFANEYIDEVNNVSICKICGELLPMFDQDEKSYVQKDDGDIVLTSVKENIFDYDPYRNFVDAQIFFLDTISFFDNIFKSNTIIYSNDISKLTIDFLIYLSENRLKYEKDNEFKRYIVDYDLFFLRLSNKFFTYSDDKEEYINKKKLNIYIILTLVILTYFGFDIVKQIITNRNINLKEGNSYLFFISKIVEIFLQRNKIQFNKKNISSLVDVYLNLLFNNELKIRYNKNLNVYNNNINNVKGKDILYILESQNNININKNIKLESFKKSDWTYSKEIIYLNEKVICPQNDVNDFMEYLHSNLNDYEEFIKSDMFQEFIEKFTFPKLYWKNYQIKIKPKELNNFIFLISLDKTNKFIYVDRCLTDTNINVKNDSLYYFFHFGDPFPFISKLSEKHYRKNIDSIIRLIIQFFPNINTPLNNFFNYNIDRNYIYYLYLKIFNYLTNNNLYEWINNNKLVINEVYEVEKNKYYTFIDM